ncbi:PSD1 and planctomycete cytochrome C domain-containing protein [Thalassoroseus pseudoceratinae]|uniref:PSD1 and planctomycete cytochrome C domain-containing protein n=1 Tax=Thalassoroseus pseudoceratinae TaxID=2713176 RepID=UPI00141E3566|nr:PSD1 and planctomycete cytochrome C domain-containing protein [Thalassoroseus pseudoceratinae]
MKTFACALVWLIASPAILLAAKPEIAFETDIRPLFKARCFHCHGEGETEGSLDLRLRRLIVQGGDAGPSIVPGKADESYLVDRIRDHEMPPADSGEPLTEAEIATITKWINSGAKTLRPEPEKIGQGMLITEEDRQFWAFQPMRKPKIPTVGGLESPNPIDAFIARKLHENELDFAPKADKRVLVRRAYFDLIGLPPTPEEVANFLADDRPDAWEQLIDRLLSSPHYGERWGRHWLDVAGYADSEGANDKDTIRPWAYKYRDYVINAFNNDKPFDQFVREQLAGDELITPPYAELTPDEIEKLTATGFLRLAPDGTAASNAEPVVTRNEVVANTVEIMSSSLLGLTVQCAQCHEHRYDPIPQADYYRLRAIIEPALNPKKWRRPVNRLVSLYTAADRAAAAKLEAEAKAVLAKRTERQKELIEAVFRRELAKLPEAERATVETARNTPVKERSPEQKELLAKYPSVNVSAGSLYLYDRKAADELKKLAADAKAIRDRKPKQEFLRALTENPGEVPETHLFHRGDPDQPKEVVEPAGLTILGDGQTPPTFPVNTKDIPTTGRRLAFANYLTSGQHPLLTRVFVNRVWRHHLGRGIVNTPSDFGQLGDRPSHPELLDWLATEFIDRGWSVKTLHRMIMTSQTYRQALATDSKTLETDPDNRLFSGARLRRLDAETLRDSILKVCGRINDEIGGKPVPIMADRAGQWVLGIENLSAGRPGPVLPLHGQEFRRSVYVQVRRSRPLDILDAFDWPRMEPNCNARASSTVAPQSLMLMNGQFTLDNADHLAEELQTQFGTDLSAQIHSAWLRILCRPPSPQELATATDFVNGQAEEFAKQPDMEPVATRHALASLCQVLLGSNEFLYVD